VTKEAIRKGIKLKSVFMPVEREKMIVMETYSPRMRTKNHKKYSLRKDSRPVTTKEVISREGIACRQVNTPPTFDKTKGLK